MITVGEIIKYLSTLLQTAFTGSVTIHFHQGVIKKVAKTETIL